MNRSLTVVLVVLLGVVVGCREKEEKPKGSAKGEDREDRVGRVRRGNELEAKSRRGTVEVTLSTRSWQVPADIFGLLSEAAAFGAGPDPSGEEDPFAGEDSVAGEDPFGNYDTWGPLSRWPAIDALKELGFDFPPGSSADFSPVRGELTVTNTEANLDWIAKMIEDLGPLKMWVVDEGLFRRVLTAEEQEQERARELVERKLKEIRIPVVDFDDTTVEEAFQFLRQQTRQHDVAEKGEERKEVKFSIQAPQIDAELDAEGGLGAIGPGTARVKELKLRDVPVVTVLQYLCDSSRLRYKIDHEGVTLHVLGGEPDLYERRWRVDPILVASFREMAERSVDTFGGAEEAELPKSDGLPLVDLLKEVGIDFPPGASVDYNETTRTLRMLNGNANLDLVDKLFGELAFEVSRERALGIGR